MSVTWLYCEGKTDPPVLRAAFLAMGISNIIPEATGTNPAKVASWKREQGDRAASVSDRDYRPRSQCDATFVAGGRKFYWRRHSIENYLLEPVVVAKSFELLKASMAEVKYPPNWLANLPTSASELSHDLQIAAETIRNAECGCLCLHRLWSDLGDKLGHLQCPIPPLLTSAAPQTSDECFKELTTSAEKIVATAKSWTNDDLLTVKSIKSRYDKKLKEASDPIYIDSNSFLEEFHGKRLKRSFLQVLQEKYKVSLGANLLQEELVKGFEAVLVENSEASVGSDIRELATLLETN